MLHIVCENRPASGYGRFFYAVAVTIELMSLIVPADIGRE
jgi:hypothetical protein